MVVQRFGDLSGMRKNNQAVSESLMDHMNVFPPEPFVAMPSNQAGQIEKKGKE